MNPVVPAGSSSVLVLFAPWKALFALFLPPLLGSFTGLWQTSSSRNRSAFPFPLCSLKPRRRVTARLRIPNQSSETTSSPSGSPVLHVSLTLHGASSWCLQAFSSWSQVLHFRCSTSAVSYLTLSVEPFPSDIGEIPALLIAL